VAGVEAKKYLPRGSIVAARIPRRATGARSAGLVAALAAAVIAAAPALARTPADHPPPLVLCLPAHAGTGVLCALVEGERPGAAAKLIRPPDLQAVRPFAPDGSGGWIAPARDAGGGWGYVDGSGRWVHEPTLDDARTHSGDGLARFARDGRWGFVDTRGAVVIEPRYPAAGPFAFGLAPVQVGSGWSYLGPSGELAIRGPFELARPFSAKGLAAVRKRGSDKIGYIDRTGKQAIPPRFDVALEFSANGLAPAAVERTIRGPGWELDQILYGLIDTAGAWVLEPRYSGLEPFGDHDLASFEDMPPGEWAERGFLDATGREALRGQDLSRRIGCGLVKEGHRGRFRRLDGNVAFERSSLWVSDFSEQCVALALHDRRLALLRPDGSLRPLPPDVREPLLDDDYDLVRFWTPGLVHAVTDDGDVAYVDAEGVERFRARLGAGPGETHSGASLVATGGGEALWQESLAAGARSRFTRSELRLFRSEREDAVDPAVWREEARAVVERLRTAKPRAFYPCSISVYSECEDPYDVAWVREEYGREDADRDLIHHGALLTLARHSVDEAAWGRFQFLDHETSERLEGYFRAWEERLTAALGAPLGDETVRPLKHGDGGALRAWKLGDRTLVLEHFVVYGDGDFEHQLLLAVVDHRSNR
jgi:hypothetical protein